MLLKIISIVSLIIEMVIIRIILIAFYASITGKPELSRLRQAKQRLRKSCAGLSAAKNCTNPDATTYVNVDNTHTSKSPAETPTSAYRADSHPLHIQLIHTPLHIQSC